MLKGEETKEGQSAGGLLRGIYGDYPAFFAGIIERAIVLMGARLTVHGGILSTPSPAVNRRANLFEAVAGYCRAALPGVFEATGVVAVVAGEIAPLPYYAKGEGAMKDLRPTGGTG